MKSLYSFFLLILLTFILILSGCSQTTEYQENIRNLEDKVSKLEVEKEDLLKQIEKLKSEKALGGNEIVVQKSEIEYTFDDARHNLFDALYYNDQYYVPISFFPSLYKKELQVIDKKVYIGGQNILNEGLKLKDSFVSSQFTRSEFHRIAGKPLTSEQFKDECHFVDAIVDYYDGLTINYNKDEDDKLMWVTIEKPIFTTHRGITVGSTIKELYNSYGRPDANNNGKYISYGDQASFIYFEIEDGKVKKMRIQYAGIDC